jgi:hypothetical protein
MRTLTSKKEVVAKRHSVFQMSSKHNTFKKGDKRVHTPRLCVVCGRPLSSLIINENRYITSNSHIHFHVDKWFTVDMCEDVNSCYRTLRKKGELEENVNGRQHKEQDSKEEGRVF